jgi:uncharacterized protein YbbC (DUF1343 family)
MPSNMSVQTGLAVLASENFKRLSGHKVGLITNPTGILPSKTTNIAAMRAAGVNLYGKTRQPTVAMLTGLDLLVFELQDIGARSYTYLSSLGAVLEASAQHKIPVMVLDRPNPAGLQAVEGGPTRAGFSSFISKYPVAYRHGMTLGEVGKMLIGEGMVSSKAQLSVVACKNLTRGMFWEDCALPWVPTSPNIPTPSAAWLYHATGIIGESSQISIGIGTDAPFGYLGAPSLNGREMGSLLKKTGMQGFEFAEASWTPTKGAFVNKKCTGVRVIPTSKSNVPVTYLNFATFAVLKQIAPKLNLFADAEETRMVDLSCGTDAVRKAFLKGASLTDIVKAYEFGLEGFIKDRQKYLIYK